MKPTTVSFPDVNALAILNGWVSEGGLDSAIEFPSLDMQNDSGQAIREGDVVVVLDDGTIAWSTTPADPRPTGVALDDIDDGDSGPVQFLGPVDFIRVTASVTAGNWGRTSTTAGEADEVISPTGGFVYFTSSGTEPEGFLMGPGGSGGGGGGSGGGGSFGGANGLSVDGMVPYAIPSGEEFVVPLYKQGLFNMTIDVVGTLTVDGYLIEVVT